LATEYIQIKSRWKKGGDNIYYKNNYNKFLEILEIKT
jgi:hypothetical protein